MMTQIQYFTFIKSKLVRDFINLFGGNFSYSPEFTYTYEYGKKLYFLANHNFKKDIKRSIKNEENLLLTYDEVHW